MVGEVVNLPVTDVPGCISSNAKTLGQQHPQFLDSGAGGGPAYTAFLIERPLLLFRRDPSVPSLCVAF
jgi:hypothetical protein